MEKNKTLLLGVASQLVFPRLHEVEKKPLQYSKPFTLFSGSHPRTVCVPHHSTLPCPCRDPPDTITIQFRIHQPAPIYSWPVLYQYPSLLLSPTPPSTPTVFSHSPLVVFRGVFRRPSRRFQRGLKELRESTFRCHRPYPPPPFFSLLTQFTVFSLCLYRTTQRHIWPCLLFVAEDCP